MLGYLPGLLHAWYIIAKFPDATEYEALPQDAERGTITYIYVQGPDGQSRRVQQKPRAPKNSGTPQGYGSTAPLVAPEPHQESNGTWNEPSGSGESSSTGGAVPPSYADAIRGDHKIQTS